MSIEKTTLHPEGQPDIDLYPTTSADQVVDLDEHIKDIGKGDTGATPNITVRASVDNSTGVPEVDVKRSGTIEDPVFLLEFKNLKGAKGDRGDDGKNGEVGPAPNIQMVGTVTSDGSGVPAVEISKSGLDTSPIFRLVFKNIQGPQGPISDNAPIVSASATVDDNIGTPEVEVTKKGTFKEPEFEFHFKNLKGEKGDPGQDGTNGTDGITPDISAQATVDDTSDNPRVEVEKSGTLIDPAFLFKFFGLKGQKGDPGKDGTNGTDGAPGAPGEPGKNGTDGRGVKDIELNPGSVSEDGSTYNLDVTYTDSDEPQLAGDIFVPNGKNGTNGTSIYSSIGSLEMTDMGLTDYPISLSDIFPQTPPPVVGSTIIFSTDKAVYAGRVKQVQASAVLATAEKSLMGEGGGSSGEVNPADINLLSNRIIVGGKDGKGVGYICKNSLSVGLYAVSNDVANSGGYLSSTLSTYLNSDEYIIGLGTTTDIGVVNASFDTLPYYIYIGNNIYPNRVPDSIKYIKEDFFEVPASGLYFDSDVIIFFYALKIVFNEDDTLTLKVIGRNITGQLDVEEEITKYFTTCRLIPFYNGTFDKIALLHGKLLPSHLLKT